MIESPVTRADEVFGTRRAEVDGGDGPHGDDRAAGVALLVGAQHPPAVHGGHDCAGPDRLRAPARAVVGTLHDRLAGVDDVRARVGKAHTRRRPRPRKKPAQNIGLLGKLLKGK
jgi:hypothetical protein